MRSFGLIGYPLGHSFSPAYFEEKFKREGIEDASYQAFPLEDVSYFPFLVVREVELCGLNVTVPYKKQILPYLNRIDPLAEKIGAVNTIKIENAELVGYNTDIEGFVEAIRPLLPVYHESALILGNGGSAMAVKAGLESLGIDYKVVSRSKDGDLNYDAITKEIVSENTIVINTTPLGMFPDVDFFPNFPYEYLSNGHLCFDLIYNPEETAFMRLSAEQGAKVSNGLEMLKAQAEASWRIWNT